MAKSLWAKSLFAKSLFATIQLLSFSAALFLGVSACQKNHFIVSTAVAYDSLNSSKSEKKAISDSIGQYKQKVDAEMNAVIGTAAQALTKQQPESDLGNFVADAVHAQAELYSKTTADLTVLNHGGLRVDGLPKGDWTRGNIFELLPFDNMVVIVEIKGAQVNQLLAHIVKKEGWPVSRHLRMEISAGAVKSATINGQVIDEAKTYKVVTNDYLANGGDNCLFFAGQTQIETGVFIRDAVIEYIQAKTAKKEAIEAKVEGRLRRLD
jgi:2',3'-cyclic-nucleotide 2'-phosphodiesterase (5'-nucleotidase family)